MKSIPYGRQFLDKLDEKEILKSLSNDLITTGPLVKKFEERLKKFLQCNYAHVCSSGTAAIHLAMMAIDLKKDDIILMPAVNFVAAYNIARTLQLKIYLVDVDEFTGQITPELVLECLKKYKLKNFKALLVMYNGGYPESIKNLYDLKKRYNFYLIEYACHALGSEYRYAKEKFFKTGSCKHSDICTFSLHPLKTITTGEGGIVTTNNKNISKNIRLLRNHGIRKNELNYWMYDVVKNGLNYRISDINCALGLSQLKKIKFFISKRKKIFNKYFEELNNFNLNLRLIKYSKNLKSSFHLFIININFDNLKKNKNHFIRYMIRNKIFVQQHYIPLYKFSVYNGKIKKLIGSEKYFNNSISIPIFVNLTSNDIARVVKVIKKYFIYSKN